MEELAELNVKQCKMNHDVCRSTSDFRYAGQNLAYRSTTAPDFEDVDFVISSIVNGWYSEIRYAEQSDIDMCCTPASGNGIGHFTMTVSDKSIQIGCAIARYTTRSDYNWKGSLVACNYAYNNMIGLPIYVSGPTASNCSTGVNPDFPALCSVDEPIIPMPWV